MKKIFYFILLLVLITGCRSNRDLARPVNPGPVTDFGSVNNDNQTNMNINQSQDQSDNSNATNPSAKVTGAIISTNYGDIIIEFYTDNAPNTVNNFARLALKNFYDQTKFHRVIKGFMIQGGDPLSKESDVSLWGKGGPGYSFSDEINDYKLVKGSMAMANSGPNTNGSQFFIVTAESTPWLDGKHTNFGKVVGGLDVVEKISELKTDEFDRPVSDVVITGINIKGEELVPDISVSNDPKI